MEIKVLKEPVEMTPEREGYHRWLGIFREKLAAGGLIYDIGKSDRFDYSEFLNKFTYKTIDFNGAKSPDIFLDIEDFGEVSPGLAPVHVEKAQAVLCNGVMEQCGDPVSVVTGINKLLDRGGLVLMGIMSIGFPIYATDRTRLTPHGAEQLMIDAGFEVLQKEIIYRDAIASYVFLICRKDWHA